MAAGVERGAFDVGGMAAVTFTRKAAAELRGRFQEALEERLRRGPDGDEQRRLRGALDGIERLFAGTIHAFCAHLLRERPVDAEVAPGFDELGDADNVLLRKQAWRDFVVEQRAAGSRSMLDLLEAGVRPSELDVAFAAVCEHEDVAFDPGSGTAPDAGPVWQEVDRFWASVKALRPPEFPGKTTCPLQQRFDEYDGRIRLARRDRVASLAAFCKAWKGEVIQKHWAGRGKEVKALADAFTSTTVEPFLEAWLAYVHSLAMRVLVDARGGYAEVRRRRNAVNYVDLLRVTARMLRERGHVRRALQAKYRWLFIDEFQDTDPIQAEIFLMLAAAEPASPGGGNGGPAVDPFALPLRPGSLFVVGDPKQSIFRFRRADIDIYNRVGDRIVQTGGERLSLTANFRSLPAVCALANQLFPPLFAAFDQPWSPAFEPLHPVRSEASGGEGPRIAKLTLPDVPNSAEATRQEAAAIAGYIKGEVAAGRRKAGDFLVLTRFRTRLPEYVAALDALDVPVEVSGAGFFCRSFEVQALAGLLNALADPLDAVSLVGVLRGPLFGISDPELFRFKQAGGRFEVHAVLPEAAGEPESAALDERFGPVLPVMRRLQALHKLTWALPLGAALDAMLEETGWLALASTGPGGAPAGHLLQAIDRVREVVERGGGLAGAAEALQEDDESSEADALPLEPGRRDVVRLMNLHKAKGLEAPVVILADATHDFRFPVTLRVVRTGASAAGVLCLSHKRSQGFGDVLVGKPRDWAAHEAEEARYLGAERLRLLYVAATRAEDLLVVCRSAKQKANKAWKEFEAYLESVPELVVESVAIAAAARTGDPSAKVRMAARRAREAAHANALTASWASARVTGTVRHAEATPQSGGPEAQAAAPPSGLPPGPDGGALWGTLIHGLLEHAVRHAATTRHDLERLARWLTVETPGLRPLIGVAVDLVEGVRGASFWKEVGEAPETHVEVPFAIRLETGQSLPGGSPVTLPTVVRGVIDLAYRAADGWRVLDYKTDRDAADEAAVRARHGAQVTQYGAAWERASRQAVAGTGVVLVRWGQVLHVSISASLLKC
jgi:ATP-dependent helicase/nuclease subunit A